jgi:non-specific serine/threonine protein kinase/serine/threonine-protein kinase
MTPREEEDVKRLFAEAAALPADQREAFVRCAGAGQAAQREALSLLGHHETAGVGFLTPPQPAPPARIGPYQIERLLGQGGFGAVYLASQEEPVRRQVAVKVLKAGMDTAQIISRFQAERRALALMNHPGVARVIDAGTTSDGRPYFAMDYVRGAPITESCASLAEPERLRLFIEVCEAVQHAHQKGLIHRDLKPSNILVESIDGVLRPRVIDFGIAKAMNETGSGATQRGQVIGTPVYMSPEQAAGSPDIDTRADVYSLGVVLRELLGARDPLSAAPTLRGELAWIAMKATGPDRASRYESASALAADLRRYLSHEAVHAGPPGRLYRLKKFARRHRVGLSGVAAVGAALIAGLAVAMYGLAQAARQRDEARREARVLQSAVRFVTDDLLRAADPRVSRGRDVTVKEMLNLAAAGLDGKFADDPLVEAEIRLAIGEMERTLGRNAEAIPQLQRAIAIREERVGPGSPEALAAVRELGVVYDEQGRHAEAVSLFARVLAGRRAALGGEHPLTLQALNDLAVADERAGRLHEAENLFRATLEIRRRTPGPDHPDTLVVMNNLATVLLSDGRGAEALPLAERAAAGYAKAAGEDDRVALDCANTLGVVYLRTGRLEQAEPVLRQTLERRRRILGNDHLAVADSLSNLAECLLAGKARAVEAEPLLRDCLAIRSAGRPAGHWSIASAVGLLGESLALQARYADAEPLLLNGFDGIARSPEAPPDRKRRAAERLAELYTAWGKPEDAAAWRSRLAPQEQPPSGGPDGSTGDRGFKP